MRVDRQAELRKYHKYNSSELWLYIRRSGDGMGGFLRTPCIACAIPFEDLAQLLLKANQVFDAINLPQRFMARRSMDGAREAVIPDWIRDNLQEPPATGRAQDAEICPDTEVLPFFVRVYQRQHASWQGELRCLSSRRSCCFRSALELVELLTQIIEEAKARQDGTLTSAAV